MYESHFSQEGHLRPQDSAGVAGVQGQEVCEEVPSRADQVRPHPAAEVQGGTGTT